MGIAQDLTPDPRHRPSPVLNALLICDSATRDEESGKMSLQGIFEQVSCPSFPARHSLLVVYAKFTDAKGQYGAQLDLIHLETGNIVASAAATVVAKDQMGAVELVLQAHNVPLPEAGLYEWRLQFDGRYVGSKTFSVVLSDPPGGEP